MSAEALRNLTIGTALLALWFLTLSLAVRHPLPDWRRAGRSTRAWTAAHVVALVLGLAPVVSIVFLVAVWPRLRRAATGAQPGGHEADADHVTSDGPAARRGTPGADDPGHAALPRASASQGGADRGTGVLAVYRSAGELGALGRLRVDVDGQQRWRLKQGRVEEARLPAGEHVVQAHMDWLSSRALPVTVPADGAVRVIVGVDSRASTAEGVLLRPESALDITVVERFPRW